MKKIKTTLLIILLVIIIIMSIIIQEVIRNKMNMPNIVDINGITYIEKDNYICKLLDSNGQQIPYNEFVGKEHKFDISKLGYDYIIKDISTNKVYVLIKNDNEIPCINVMYDKNIINEHIKKDTTKTEVIVIDQ